MRQDVRLYIGDKEVELGANPQVLYNYTETDLRNPTTVKNSFTKSISIEGTPNNNDVFGQFWNLERYQDYGGTTGPAFSPITKTDFSLFVNGNLYERGYVKLNDIKLNKGGNYVYDITLFGGLGSFISRLTYQTESETDAKLTLADLDYNYALDGLETALQEWRINKDEVWNAWGSICNYGESSNTRYNFIQYVPAYEGVPENFTSDKILINYNDGLPTDIFRDMVVEDDVTYRPVNGYALGNFDGDLTPWTAFDLRSYLMRPAVRVRYIIDACANPAINGGYQLDLDEHFFNDNNPYYNNSWMTLQRFTSLDLSSSEEETISGGATLVRQSGSRSGDLFNVSYTGATLERISNTKLTMNVGFTPSDSTNATTLYTDTYYYGNSGFNRRQIYQSAGGVIIQLWAMDAMDNIVGSSNAYLLASTRDKANTETALWWNYYNGSEKDTPASYTWVDGVWTKVNGQYVFTDRGGNPIGLDFSLKANVNYDHLVMKIKWPYTYYTLRNRSGKLAPATYYYPDNDNEDNFYEVNPTGFPMYTTEYSTGSTWDIDFSEIITYNRVRGAFNYTITNFEVSTESYGEFLSNAKLSKRTLLGGDKTPADILLSFAKLFGLYFYYDPSEEADDPTTCPNGVVHLMDRDTFFTEEVVDIDDRIDYSKTSTIIPTVAASKWLSFNTEQVESQVNNDYVEKYGYDYGRQLVNTSYSYDLGTTQLYDGNAFKGGVTVREKNTLYAYGMASYGGENNITYRYPNFIANKRLTYSLFNGTDSTELEVGGYLSSLGYNINNLGLGNYDSFPKVQFHTDDNSPSDGSGVLLFLNGSYDTVFAYDVGGSPVSEPLPYYITDDVPTMATLNDNEPCYLFTLSEFDAADNRIARAVTTLPNFTRDWINAAEQEGYIVHSWNFGHPQDTFVPNVYSTDGDSIYDKTWKDYIKDLYDVNTKSLTVNVKLDNVSVSLLRKYFWFRNAIWRLNKIKDYNCNSYDTVQCEFIKVQDTENYKLEQITAGGIHRLTLDSYTVPASGGVINGTVYLQDGGTWTIGDVLTFIYSNGDVVNVDADEYISPVSSSGVTSYFTLTIPENDTPYNRQVRISIEYDEYIMRASVAQQTNQCNITFEQDYADINQSGGTVVVAYSYTNIDPATITSAITYGYNIPHWATVVLDTENKTVTISGSANTSGAERRVLISLSATSIINTVVSDTLTVIQDGGELYVNPLTLIFDYDSTTGDTLTITTSGDWSATINDTQ